MRQWPAEHFAALVDLLIDAEGVNAVLVGGPDEIALAQEVLDKIVRRDAVVSLTGRTTLAELTALLACCALYVGNNSGPKHIAAAMGVPTNRQIVPGARRSGRMGANRPAGDRAATGHDLWAVLPGAARRIVRATLPACVSLSRPTCGRPAGPCSPPVGCPNTAMR